MDINNLGTFSDINAVWAAYPEGGNEGDYLYIGGVKYRWDKYGRIWKTAGEVTESPARKLVTSYGDMAVNNDLHVGGTLYCHRLAGNDLGLFASLAALQAAHPTPKVGQWAFVVHPTVEDKYQIYTCETAGTWTLSVSETTLDVLGFDKYEETLELMQQIANGRALTGYRAYSTLTDLPTTDVDPTLGYLVGGHLYVWVETGGDTLGGKYQDCGLLRGEKGEKGDKGDKGDDAVVLDGVNVHDTTDISSFDDVVNPANTVTSVTTAKAMVGKQESDDLEIQKNIFTHRSGTSSSELGLTNVRLDSSGHHNYIDNEGVVTSSTASGYSNFRLYQIGVFRKGDIYHRHAVNASSSGSGNARRLCYGWTDVDPSSLEDVDGLQLYDVYDKNNVSEHDIIMQCPYETGYLVMFYYNHSTYAWTSTLDLWVNDLKDKQDALTWDEQPVKGSMNPVTSDGVFTRVSDLVKGLCNKKTLTDFGGSTSLTNLVIDGSGLVISGSDKARVVYVKNMIPKGTLISFSGVSSVERVQRMAVMLTDPADDESPLAEGTQLDMVISTVTNTGEWTQEVFMPVDGWLVYYYYNEGWSSREIAFSVPTDTKESLARLNVQVNGILSPVVIRTGKGVNWNTGTGAVGSWGSPSGWNTYIYDVSEMAGQILAVDCYKRANFYQWAFVTDWEQISAGTWSEVALSKPSKNNHNTTGYHWKLSLTVPEGARHLLVMGNGTSYPQSVITGDSLNGRITALEDTDKEKSILEYNEDREGILQQTTLAVKGYTRQYLRLLHFSDLHGDAVRLKRLLDWHEAHVDIIDDIINTGDTVASKFSNANPFASASGSNKILTAIGNHDTAASVTVDGVSKTEWFQHHGLDAYNKFIKPYITSTVIDEDTQQETVVDNWQVTQPDGADENGYCYYYKDYASGFRLIVLDAMSYAPDDHQRTWFQQTLADARTQGLHVVCAFHFCYYRKVGIKTDFSPWTISNASGYTISNSPSLHYDNKAQLIHTDLQAFIDAGGVLACCLVGHSHSDKIFYPEGFPAQLCIMVDAACCTSSADHWNTVRKTGTRSQDSFNVVAMEKTATRLWVIKIGCDSNCVGQHVDWTCLDYTAANREPLYTVGNMSYINEAIPVEPDHDDDGDVEVNS